MSGLFKLAILLVLLVFACSLVFLGFNFLEKVPNFIDSKDVRNCPKLSGRIVSNKDSSYNKDRLGANYYASKKKFPAVIVYCQNTQDVQNAVLYAKCKKLPIRIRSGGHNHEGYSTGDGVVLIDVSEMKGLKLDTTTNTATIEPGINNLELYSQLFKQGLTHVGGTCSEVGLSGLALSGGMGPLLRKEGLTCDTLISVDMVAASGEVIHATKDNEHKDLLWALCGGGAGNFGVVTSMEIKVYPATDVTWFNIGWNWDQPIEQVIGAWLDFYMKPDSKNWFSHLDIWAKPFPAEKQKKQPVKALGVFWGTPEEAREQLSHLLSIGKPQIEKLELVKWDEAIKLFEDSTAVFLTEIPEYKSSGAFVMDQLPPEATKIIVNALRESTSPYFNVLFEPMGGAISDIPPSNTAFFYRDAKFFINYTSQWLNENEDQKQKAELEGLRDRLLPYTVGDYVGNPDPDLKDYLTAYYGDNVDQLKQVKCKYDPENIFQFEQSIPPGSGCK